MAKKAAKPARRAAPSTVVIVNRSIRGRFDAAQTTDDNRRHWANADALSPNASITPEVRRKLRDRCRYEVANNSYAKGIGLTVANDTIGIGPTLQITTGDDKIDALIEGLISDWMTEIRIAEKLRQMRFAKYDSGEAFAFFGTNPALRSPVKIDLGVIEAEQISNPTPTVSDWSEQSDGIQYDDFGNPTTYRKLKVHPGSMTWNAFPTAYDDIPAEFVFHYFRADRPGQLRGIPEIVPAIGDFADLRRFTLATIAAAETAAEHAAMIETDAPVDPEISGEQEGEGPKTWDLVEIQKRAAVVLPSGYKMSQFKPEHPTTTYKEFVNAKLNEIARCLCVPFHIAAMDPSIANMSSSYVVGQMYTKERLIDRSDLENLLNMAMRMALNELRLGGLIPVMPAGWTHQWNWPSLSHHADPGKEAAAAAERLGSGTTTYALEFAKQGLDAAEQLDAQAKLLGISPDEYRHRLLDKLFGTAVKPQAQPQQENPNDQQDQQDNANARDSGANGNGRRITG